MDKLKMQSKSMTEENIAYIAKKFPNCITEGRVDFDLLRQELSTVLVEGKDERYRIDWNGKRQAILTANSPIAKTLRPCPKESVNFDSTENLYIEGDNLDVLKLLHATYLGKIKMIYIDPPYNTGSDFVYADDFAEDAEEYLAKSNQKDDQGKRLVTNKETSGRYHSDWLSMMYMRLKLARDLLTEDGVTFISIDDNEQANLKRICDEIFGEGNFVATFPWRKRTAKSDVPFGVSQDYEWVLCYAKSQEFKASVDGKGRKYFESPDFPGRPWRIHDMTKQTTASERPNSFFTMVNPKDGKGYPCDPNKTWRITKETFPKYLAANEIIFPGDYAFLNITKPVMRYFKDSDMAKDGDDFGRVALSTKFPDDIGMSQDGTKGIKELFETIPFSFPKPVSLIKFICKTITKDNDIILDFFSGSGTTAHAVMQLNAEDGGNRKYIMVQLDEKTEEKSEAYNAGFKTITEIGKERIRRAGKKIIEEASDKEGIKKGLKNLYKDKEHFRSKQDEGWAEKFLNGEITLDILKNQLKGTQHVQQEIDEFINDLLTLLKTDTEKLDVGFRVLKLDDSNMKDTHYNPSKYDQSMILGLDSSIKDDRTAEDILFQVMLEKGVQLSSKIEKRTTANAKQTFYIVGNTGFGIIDLICCLDKKIDTNAIKEIAKLQPECCVFLDSGMDSDATRTNVQQVFDTYSPKTKVEVL